MMMMMMMKKEKQTTLWSRLRPCFELEFTIDGIYRLCHKEETRFSGTSQKRCLTFALESAEAKTKDKVVTI